MSALDLVPPVCGGSAKGVPLGPLLTPLPSLSVTALFLYLFSWQNLSYLHLRLHVFTSALFCNLLCYRLDCATKFMFKPQSPVWLFGYRAFNEIIKIIRAQPQSYRTGDFIRRDTRHLCTEERLCEHTARRWQSTSQEERSHLEPPVMVPWPWT